MKFKQGDLVKVIKIPPLGEVTADEHIIFKKMLSNIYRQNNVPENGWKEYIVDFEDKEVLFFEYELELVTK